MYTIHIYQGTVTRDSDGVVVSPAQSTEDPNYVEYISWVEDGNTPTVDDAQPPAQPVEIRLSKVEFMDRFTAGELETIYSMETASTQIKVWLERFRLSEFINLADPRTMAGVQSLEAAGILQPGRANEILAG